MTEDDGRRIATDLVFRWIRRFQPGCDHDDMDKEERWLVDSITRAVRDAVEAERAECAKVADCFGEIAEKVCDEGGGAIQACLEIAATIRARGDAP